jgi:hypothetical protein
VAARSFSTSASTRASLNASESRSATAAAVVVWVAVAQSFADCLGRFEGRSCRCFACHYCGHHHSSHDELHLQLSPLCAELSCRARSSLT